MHSHEGVVVEVRTFHHDLRKVVLSNVVDARNNSVSILVRVDLHDKIKRHECQTMTATSA